MPTEFVLLALEQALTLRQPAPGLIVHADCGSQYTSATHRARAGSGWSTLKTELLPHGTAFASIEEARLEVVHYLDTYINPDRRHSALGYRSPPPI